MKNLNIFEKAAAAFKRAVVAAGMAFGEPSVRVPVPIKPEVGEKESEEGPHMGKP